MATYKLTTPITEEQIRRLKANDVVYVTGTIVTARDQAHKRALQFHKEGKKLPISLEGLAVFHCGPIVKKDGDGWVVVAAGPTTSTRMDIFEDEFIENFKVRVIIGKGGMGEKTLAALKEVGAVYCSFTGGCGALAAKGLKEVRSYEWQDLGMPEALWVITAEEFGPLLVTMDSHGNSLHAEMDRKVASRKADVYAHIGIEE